MFIEVRRCLCEFGVSGTPSEPRAEKPKKDQWIEAMPRKALIDNFCRTVKVETRTDFWDDLVRGLVLRVSPTGVKTWSVIYTREADSAKRRVTVGAYPVIGLEAARKKALKMMSAVADGDDPAGRKRARREELTVEELASLFIEKYAKRNKRTWQEDERNLRSAILPDLGRFKVREIRKRDILDVIEAKADEGRVGQARALFALVRKLFNWAAEGDYVEVSPLSGARAPGKPVRRERHLSQSEIEQVFAALEKASLEPETKDIVRLLFWTGQRSGEVCGITRREIDLQSAAWTLPGSRTKNGLSHVVPLTGAALEIVRKRMAQCDDEPDAPLFSRLAGQAISSHAISQGVRKKLQIFDERWTPHDARRTVATGMADIGILPHVIEACLNHISGFRVGVAGTYNRSRYEPEKRRALAQWADHLNAVVTGQSATVVPLWADASV